MKYDSISEIVAEAVNKNCAISAVVINDQAAIAELSPQELLEKMSRALDVMKESAEHGLEATTEDGKEKRSTSGLSGCDALKMRQAVAAGKNICGSLFGNALTKALAVSFTNSCMGKIVAAPTAGSCGILPAALLSVAEDRGLSDDAVVKALFTASGFGIVIANNASIAGAEGGCQAECGSAAAMAAAALTELCGGTPAQCEHACAIALKNVLGLVCDPVAGLVEVPCIKRNAAGVANAFVAAELALAGIESTIPADEVILAMKKIGDAMSAALKETAEGGLAATPTGKRLCKKIFGKQSTVS